MVKMTELQNAVFNRFTIHYLKYSTQCAIFRSGIWPNPNARKWRLQARWGRLPLFGLGGQHPPARKPPGGQIWPTAGLVSGAPRPLPGAGCRGVAGGTPCTVLSGLTAWRAGQKWHTHKNATGTYSEPCRRDSGGSWPNAS